MYVPIYVITCVVMGAFLSYLKVDTRIIMAGGILVGYFFGG